MNLGLRWLPQWSSSPVKDSAFGVSGAKKTPFHRLLWELFAVSLWDKASLLGADGNSPSPSKNSRLWPFSAECKEWASRYILPLFCYFDFPRGYSLRRVNALPTLNLLHGVYINM